MFLFKISKNMIDILKFKIYKLEENTIDIILAFL